MSNILIDTCFWYGLYDTSDQHHHQSYKLADYLHLAEIIIPFPTLYETLNTRFTSQALWLNQFEILTKNSNIHFIDDTEYKENVYALTVDSSINRHRPLSLVDMVIRLMLEDVNLKIDYLITYNKSDFIDVCTRKNIILLDGLT